jgi:sortase (surface protein transpeptidase)
VSAPVVPLHLNRNKTLQVPTHWGQAGWFVGGPEPGETGAAVIAGHVDSKSGPAVFFRLRALRPGDLIKVVLKNRSTVRFVVRSKRAVPKKRFPTKLVFGKTTAPTLRLITCDGRFDRSTGHYVDNLVVFAALV